MRFHTKNQGYSLIEVLVSITILLVAIVGPMTIAATGLKNVQFAREQNVAIFLAQEGIEKTHQRRDEFNLDVFFGGSTDTWSDFVSDITAGSDCGTPNGCTYGFKSVIPVTCDPVAICDIEKGAMDGVIVYTRSNDGDADDPSSLEETEFSRVIFVEDQAGVLHVTSRVIWNSKSTGESEQFELHSYLYNTYDL